MSFNEDEMLKKAFEKVQALSLMPKLSENIRVENTDSSNANKLTVIEKQMQEIKKEFLSQKLFIENEIKKQTELITHNYQKLVKKIQKLEKVTKSF
jgi:hypothetical protein